MEEKKHVSNDRFCYAYTLYTTITYKFKYTASSI